LTAYSPCQLQELRAAEALAFQRVVLPSTALSTLELKSYLLVNRWTQRPVL